MEILKKVKENNTTPLNDSFEANDNVIKSTCISNESLNEFIRSNSNMLSQLVVNDLIIYLYIIPNRNEIYDDELMNIISNVFSPVREKSGAKLFLEALKNLSKFDVLN